MPDGSMRYKVVFTGKIAKGYILEKVKKSISEYFKLDYAEVEKLFSRKAVTVKNNADYRTALKIKTAMENAGALCEILKAVENTPEPLHRKAKGNVEYKHTEEDLVTCPECGFQQKNSKACLNCSIKLKKFDENVKDFTGNTGKEKKSDNYSILNGLSERKKRDWMPIAVLGVILTIFLVILVRSLFGFLSDSTAWKDALRTISEKPSPVHNKPPTEKTLASKSEGSSGESGNKTITSETQNSAVPTSAGKDNFQKANDLIAFYPFNGNANDESGNGNHGTVVGASLVKDRFGNEGSAYSFDGVNDFVGIGYPLVSGNFTISFWLKSNGRQNQFAVPISQGSMNYKGFNFTFTKSMYNGFSWGTWNAKKVSGSNRASNVWHTIDFNFPEDINTDLTWHHLTATHKDNTIAVYRDGLIQGKTSWFPINFGSFEFNIGRSSGNRDYNHRAFNGVIDDIRIYNRALSEEEVLGLYENREVAEKIQLVKEKGQQTTANKQQTY